MDKRVEIYGASKADLNGKRGMATDFHFYPTATLNKDTYTVQLDGGEVIKAKPGNVRAEPGARKKKKGRRSGAR